MPVRSKSPADGSKVIRIGDRLIGDGQPCFIIAEACDNHLGKVDLAKEMVRQAKLCGADAIKFQHHLPDEEMLAEGIPQSSNFSIPLYDFLKRYSLTIEDHAVLKSYCESVGIMYLCTPFSTKAALELNELGVDAFKIGSGELTDLPSLRVIARLRKPMILSTGMATWSEIDETIKHLSGLNESLLLMNCTSEYPARHRDVNLGVIAALRERYGLITGHSDHTPDIATCIAAVALGAQLLEKHFILDCRQAGPDQSVSIDPFEFGQLVRSVRSVEDAMGTEKKVHALEEPIRTWATRSLVTVTPVRSGTVLTEAMVWTKRPGTGIAPRDLDKVLGRRVNRDLPTNHQLQWHEIQ